MAINRTSAHFTFSGQRDMIRVFNRLGARAPKAAARALNVEAQAIMRKSKRRAPADLGVLRSAGFVARPITTPRGASITMGYGGAASKYAVYVHEGTGPAAGQPPYMPPVEAIRPWARRVLGDETKAFVVARAIGRRGTRPNKFLEAPLREAIPGMAARLAKRMEADLIRGARTAGGAGGRSYGRQVFKGRVRRRRPGR